MKVPECPNCKTSAFIYGGRIAYMQYWFCSRSALGWRCGWSTEVDVREPHERTWAPPKEV